MQEVFGANTTARELISKLPSYDFEFYDRVGESMAAHDIASDKLRRLGKSALGELVGATGYPNIRIRRLVLPIICRVAESEGLELDLMSVFVRASSDIDPHVRRVAIGGIGCLCRSLAKKQKFGACERCIKYIAIAVRDPSKSVRFAAGDLPYRFDRTALVPQGLRNRLRIGEFPRKWLQPLPKASGKDADTAEDDAVSSE